MSRLIDVDIAIEDLKQFIKDYNLENLAMVLKIIMILQKQPTAFDVDNVIGELELLRDKAQSRREEFIEFNSNNNVIIKNIEYERGRVYAFDDAIEVIKAGGLDEGIHFKHSK